MDFIVGEVLYFDKPLEWTSFALVKKVRWMIRKKLNVKKIKVGHAGTLDPLATGLVIICTGKATKRIDEFQSQEKEYTTTMKFGETTPCFDLEKEVDKTYPFEHITKESVEEALKDFIGEIDQVPPVFSAVKVDGKRAYSFARKEQEVVLKSKKIVITEFEITDFNLPYISFRIVCSKGTYIRSLARDLGEKLNSGAHLVELRRTQSGEISVKNAMSIDDFEKKLNNFETNLE